VHSVSHTEIGGNESLPAKIIFTDKFNKFVSHQYHVINDIIMNRLEKFHHIKFHKEGLNSSIDSIKMIVKHVAMMNNQIE
jgi:hypothetical protein